MPVAEYRRRLAAIASRRRPDPRSAAPVRIEVPADAVPEDEVLETRARFPRAFAAIDTAPDLSIGEIAARERLVTEAIRVGYLPPD
ncbi:MAG: hypothetical protein JWQ92_1607 [Amnibacterium sp.]|nr:hypothetical protein [Amnibacterium sp.]